MSYCPACGQQSGRTDIHCLRCGTALPAASPVSDAVRPNASGGASGAPASRFGPASDGFSRAGGTAGQGTPGPGWNPAAGPGGPGAAAGFGGTAPRRVEPQVSGLSCPACGAPLLVGVRHCTRCGALVTGDWGKAPETGPDPEVQNTSGQKGSVPPEVRGGWNWGAAFTPVWPLVYGAWWVIPVYGAMLVAGNLDVGDRVEIAIGWGELFLAAGLVFYFGTQGNALAWRNRPFRSVVHFQEVQGRWMAWGVPLGILFILCWLFVLAYLLLVSTGVIKYS